MADSEKTEKSGKWRKFWNCYQQELFAVFLVFLLAGGVHLVRRLIRQLRQEKDKPE